MNLQRIRYFLSFCETMHFTNTARRLRISQPALTKAIATLEQELGTRLIRREGKHTHLTQHGISARDKYTELMSTIEKVEQDISEALNDGTEQLRIAVISSLDFTLFAGFLTAFHRRHPNVFLDISDCAVEGSSDFLLEGKVDCLLTTDCEALHNRAVCISLYEESMVVVGCEPSSPTTPSKHVQNTIESKLNNGALKANQLFNFNSGEYSTVANCSQQRWIRQLVEAGMGYGFSHNRDENNGGVAALSSDTAIEKQTISAAIPMGRSNNKVVRKFVRMLEEHAW